MAGGHASLAAPSRKCTSRVGINSSAQGATKDLTARVAAKSHSLIQSWIRKIMPSVLIAACHMIHWSGFIESTPFIFKLVVKPINTTFDSWMLPIVQIASVLTLQTCVQSTNLLWNNIRIHSTMLLFIKPCLVPGGRRTIVLLRCCPSYRAKVGCIHRILFWENLLLLIACSCPRLSCLKSFIFILGATQRLQVHIRFLWWLYCLSFIFIKYGIRLDSIRHSIFVSAIDLDLNARQDLALMLRLILIFNCSILCACDISSLFPFGLAVSSALPGATTLFALCHRRLYGCISGAWDSLPELRWPSWALVTYIIHIYFILES